MTKAEKNRKNREQLRKKLMSSHEDKLKKKQQRKEQRNKAMLREMNVNSSSDSRNVPRERKKRVQEKIESRDISPHSEQNELQSDFEYEGTQNNQRTNKNQGNTRDRQHIVNDEKNTQKLPSNHMTAIMDAQERYKQRMEKIEERKAKALEREKMKKKMNRKHKNGQPVMKYKLKNILQRVLK